MSVHWAKADIRLRASGSDFDPRVRPVKAHGGGWSNLWRLSAPDRRSWFVRNILELNPERPPRRRRMCFSGRLRQSVRALMQATTTIPIISTAADPLESGLVKSLARPEGNVTGISTITFDLVAKRVELLKQLVPRLSRLAFIWHTKTGRQVRLKYSAQLRKQSRTSLGRAW
jgi:hypothetical protein